jgi:hypothetical protein
MKTFILSLCVLFSVMLFGKTLSFDPEGGEDYVYVQTWFRGASCRVVCPNFVSAEIEERRYNEYTGNETCYIRLYVERNRSLNFRTGKLMIYHAKGQGEEDIETYTINQSGCPPIITPTSVILEPTDEKCSFSVKVDTSDSYIYYFDRVRADSDWIKVPIENIYIYNYSRTFKVEVLDNMLKKSRTGCISLAGESISITQLGQLDYTGTASAVTSGVKVRYGIYDEGIEEFFIDDEKVFSSEGRGEFSDFVKLGKIRLSFDYLSEIYGIFFRRIKL